MNSADSRRQPPPISDVDIRLLRIFRAVVQAGGFAAAEADLNLSRSTISLYMNKLEARLGVRLCNRGRSGFSLTQRGRIVYKAMQKMMASVEDFRAEVGAVRGRLIGELKLGVVDTTVTDPACDLPRDLGRYAQQAPNVHVSLHVSAGPEIEQAVLNGELHLGIVPLLNKLTGLAYSLYYREESSLFCGAAHRFFRVPDVDLSSDDIAESRYAGRGYVETADPTEKKLDARRSATSNEMEGIAILILTGKYIGYLPTHFAKPWVEQGRMRAIRPEDFSYGSEIHVVTRKAVHHPLPVQRFMQELRT